MKPANLQNDKKPSVLGKSLKANIIANFVGKIWSAVLGLALVPLYIKFLGIELYGLVGFYTMLAAIFVFLDFGLSSTINRELARSEAKQADADNIRNLVRSLEIIYWGIAVLIAVILALISPFLATDWISSENISSKTLSEAVLLLGLVIAVQWPFSLYSGGLCGLQRQVLLNIFICAFATIRGLGAILILWLVSPTIQAFFIWQAMFGLISTIIMMFTLWHFLPKSDRRPKFDFIQLQTIWKFAAGVTAISIMGIAIRQLDKVLLSGMLSLESFGYYTLAGVLAASIAYLVGPIRSAIFPKFSELVARNDSDGVKILYHKVSQRMAVVIMPLALWICAFSHPILLLWTQDSVIADNANIVLSILVLGVAMNGIISQPYVVQLAYGWTSLSVYISLLTIVIVIPLMLWAVKAYGVVGAAGTWAAMAPFQIMLSVGFMHKRLLKNERALWYLQDTLLPSCSAGIVILIGYLIRPADLGFVSLSLFLIGVLAASYTVSVLVTPHTRRLILEFKRHALK